MSGKRGSNPRPWAWEAHALPTELLPLVLIHFSAKILFSLRVSASKNVFFHPNTQKNDKIGGLPSSVNERAACRSFILWRSVISPYCHILIIPHFSVFRNGG